MTQSSRFIHKNIIIQTPKNYLKIDALYAYISVDDEGNEGVIGAMISGQMMALVGADIERIKSLRPLVNDIKHLYKHGIKLIKMSTREEIEVIK